MLIVVSRGQSLTGSTWYHWSVDSGVKRGQSLTESTWYHWSGNGGVKKAKQVPRGRDVGEGSRHKCAVTCVINVQLHIHAQMYMSSQSPSSSCAPPTHVYLSLKKNENGQDLYVQ